MNWDNGRGKNEKGCQLLSIKFHVLQTCRDIFTKQQRKVTIQSPVVLLIRNGSRGRQEKPVLPRKANPRRPGKRRRSPLFEPIRLNAETGMERLVVQNVVCA